MTTQFAPPVTAAPGAQHRERPRGRAARMFLGRPRDPRWARPALWAILALAAVLYGLGISAQSGNSYYSAAVMSATHSWKAFFFGSLDAGNYITVDKPPLALWVQALTARVIGVNGWSLVGPSVVMGVAAVGVLYSTVRRSFGHAAAVIAALVLALTPITVAINRDNNPDTLLVLLLVLAAWALQHALRSGRLGWLLACAAFVGLGFNTKMMQAFLVLPAFALVYLACAKGGLLRRLGHLLAAGLTLAVSAFWWMITVDLIPASSRPYIGGSTNNTVWDLVIGYNGLGRVFGGSTGSSSAEGMGNGANFGGSAGLGRLFNSTMGGQISWLIPFAVIALVAALVLRGRRSRTDLARAALLLWGGWLAVHFLVFSLSAGTFHPYYTTAMAPAVAALIGAGTVAMFTAPRRLAWTLPAAVAVTGGWAFVLLRRTPSWNPWLPWLILAVTVPAVTGLVIGLLAPGARRRLVLGAVVLGLAGSLAGPAAFAASSALSGSGNGTNPTAGPSSSSGMGGMPGMGGGGSRPFGGRAPAGMGQAPSGTAPAGMGQAPSGAGGQTRRGGGMGGSVSSQLISYLEQNQGSATWLVAVSSAQGASSVILSTGKPVIAMGGFTGSDPAMTVAKLQQYVKDGKLKYVLLGSDNRGGSDNSAVTSWIKKNGTVVKASEYGASASSSSGTLYRLNG
ncbi:MAG: 4-amino-4-deoxy-L-arabinose transferase and related glycosyltransferase of family-like protein [Actinomycetia bacterium]|nr:4-amino-4-deoxy-L-arabinose transferase and related glycosyltransferase of family-like protein [Actinomycetes bacterium]